MLDRELEKLRLFGSAIIDPYIVVDRELNIIDYNGAFRALFPRQVARKLKKMRCCDVLGLDICERRCIAREALKRGQSVRYDEIAGAIQATGEALRLIGSSAPIPNAEGEPVAALVIYRNVTDEAKIQTKYKHMLDEAAGQRESLQERLAKRTAELLEANATINTLEQSLSERQRGLWEPCSLNLTEASTPAAAKETS